MRSAQNVLNFRQKAQKVAHLLGLILMYFKVYSLTPHTQPIGPSIVGNLCEGHALEWLPKCAITFLHDVFLTQKSGSYQNILRYHKEISYDGSLEDKQPGESEEFSVWPRNSISGANNATQHKNLKLCYSELSHNTILAHSLHLTQDFFAKWQISQVC